MAIFDNVKTNGALCEGVGQRRPRVAAPLLNGPVERPPCRSRAVGREVRPAPADVLNERRPTTNWSKR